MSKKRVCISIDENIWNLAGVKLPVARSEYIENSLKCALNIQDDKAKIEKELMEKEAEVKALRTQLCAMLKEEKIQELTKPDYSDAMTPIIRLVNNNGVIGENEITRIALHHNLNATDLINECKQQDLPIVKMNEPPKMTNKKNGGVIR